MNVDNIEEYSKFEKTRIISARALQLSMGAPILISVKINELDPIDLAKREFEKGLVPITIKRKNPKKI